MAVATPISETTTFLVTDPVARLREKFGDKILNVAEFRGETTITVARENLVELTTMLRDELGFDQLVDVSALDWFLQAKNAPNPDELLFDGKSLDEIEPSARFQVLYHFLSHSLNARIRLTVHLNESDANVPSVTPLYSGANFFEREVYDMLGVKFVGHPFMRRILMPDDWKGFPQRKDYALGYETVEFTHNIDAIEARKPKAIPPPKPQEAIFEIDGESTEIPIGAGMTVTTSAVQEFQDPSNETMLINLGPHHPSTHGVLRVGMQMAGEKIVGAMPDVGYLHTGIEKNMEYKTYTKAITLTDRMDYLSPLFNNLGFCLAVERLMEVQVPERANILRVLLCEINRIASHLVAVGTNAMDIGAVSMFTYAFREREYALDIFEMVSGARMMTTYFRIGGCALDVPMGFSDKVREFVPMIKRRIEEYRALLDKNPIWVERTRGVGEYTREDALQLSLTGPLLRATGVNWDLRKQQPYCGYETYEFDVPINEQSNKGDIYELYLLKILEMEQSLRIIEQSLERLNITAGPVITTDRKVAPPPKEELNVSMEALIHHFKLWTEGFKPPVGYVYQAIESPRGELGFMVSSDGTNKPHRVRVRAPSFANLQLLGHVAPGYTISDMVGLIAMTDIVLGDVDR
ncbi:MAG: NADH dehydrogenase (quinone) subunit D [Chloroflexota bacterium]|nr:MAG: NADH dehydrogenase (quinone) subunit D [Chloroflexota bacterium]